MTQISGVVLNGFVRLSCLIHEVKPLGGRAGCSMVAAPGDSSGTVVSGGAFDGSGLVPV